MIFGVPGGPGGVSEVPWGLLGASWSLLEASWSVFEPLWKRLRVPWNLCVVSKAVLGPSWAGRGPKLEPFRPVGVAKTIDFPINLINFLINGGGGSENSETFAF